MQEVNSEKVLSFASEAGRILLENGAEISRVEETMERISSNYGEKDEKFFVLSNGIFTTGRSYANAEFIPIKGARLDKVVAVNQLSRDISSEHLPFEQARRRLDEIKSMPATPAWMQLLAAALGCGGFCAIFGGSLLDCAASLLAAVVLDLFVLKVGAPYLSKTLGNICASFLGTLMCILMYSAGFGESLGNMIVGTLILLIPGVAFTNGLRDVANEDYLAGMTRLVDALMLFLCIAIGVCFAFVFHGWLSGGVVSMSGVVTDPLTGTIPFQMLASLVGTASFAVLFGVPWKYCPACGVVGMLGWAAYLLVMRFSPVGAFAATLLAATLVAFLSRISARRLHCPSTVFLICGIFPLIPGAGVFWSAYYIASSQLPEALHTGMSAVKITIAIVLGIIIAANVFHGDGSRLPKIH